MAQLEPGRAEAAAELAAYPRLAQTDAFPFVCAGCGDCCRNRRDLLLSGFDLYRLARRLDLPPRIVANAFCRQQTAPETCLPVLRLRPDAKTGDCPFFDGDCTVHAARPLACALYPLGQAIDPVTAQVEYYAQTPLCGATLAEGTLHVYLENSGILQRTGADARWAVVCTQLSHTLLGAGGSQNPHFTTAVRRIARALYFDYSLRDDFYPQFCQNLETLQPLLQKILQI